MRKSTKRQKKAVRTPTRTYMRQSPLHKLIKSGALNIYEHTAADEILAAHQMSSGLPAARDPDLNLPGAPLVFDAADNQAARRCDILEAYPRWKADLTGTEHLRVVLAILIEEQDPRRIDAELKRRNGTSQQRFIEALRHFASIRGNTPRGAKWRIDP